MADDPKSLSQDDIDALIAQASGAPASPKPSQDATPRPPAPMAAGPLGQDDIDALIDQMQPPNSSAASTVSLDQDAIDALINQTTEASGPPMTGVFDQAVTGSTASKPPVGRKEPGSISEMLESVQNAATAQVKRAGSAAPDGDVAGPLGQDDIDRLLADLGANITPKAVAPVQPNGAESPSVPTTAVAEAARSQRPGTTSSSGPTAPAPVPAPAPLPVGVPTNSNAPTLALSAEDLDALVDRQVGVTSDHGEAPMIDQSDIDALVKQLANATGAPDTKRISDALAKHEGEIDKLLEQAGDPKVTLDAIPMAQLQNASSGAGRGPGSTVSMPMIAPVQIKGARWLLAAAVLFLAMCATTLGMAVGAINGLSRELKAQHQAQLAPSESFADDFKAAHAQLVSPDDGEVAKGVLFMGRLKSRHPGHEAEIALALGRHFRAKGAFRQASEEFAALAEGGRGHFDDPRIYLDYATCLAELGDLPAATRQIYRLLADEESYLVPRDRHGLMRPADEMARNQQALQDAYLALGRLLGTAGKQGRHGGTVAGTTGHRAGGTDPSATRAASAQVPGSARDVHGSH
jgi:hypothetical protein